MSFIAGYYHKTQILHRPKEKICTEFSPVFNRLFCMYLFPFFTWSETPLYRAHVERRNSLLFERACQLEDNLPLRCNRIIFQVFSRINKMTNLTLLPIRIALADNYCTLYEIPNYFTGYNEAVGLQALWPSSNTQVRSLNTFPLI